MKSLSFALLLFAVLLSACNKEKEGEQKPSASPATPDSQVILSTSEAPGSDLKMRIAFDPPLPVMSKKTTFHVKLTDSAGAPVSDAEVGASLVMPMMDMGKNELRLAPSGTGEYTGAGQFTMSGEWEIVVTAQASDKTGKTVFNIRVED